MNFEQTGLPDKAVIRKAFDVLNDGVKAVVDEQREMIDKQIEQQIDMMKNQMREQAGDVEIPPEQEDMIERQLRAQIEQQVEQQLEMPVMMGTQAAHVILDNSSEADEEKKINLAAASIAGAAAAAVGNTDTVLDELPIEITTPAYEYWQAARAVEGGQSYEFAFAESAPETRAIALAHMINEAQQLSAMTRQMQRVQAMTGEIPEQLNVKHETLVNLRQGANFLGDADEGLKAAFDDTFQRTSDMYARSQVMPPPKPRPGMGGMRVMRL